MPRAPPARRRRRRHPVEPGRRRVAGHPRLAHRRRPAAALHPPVGAAPRRSRPPGRRSPSSSAGWSTARRGRPGGWPSAIGAGPAPHPSWSDLASRRPPAAPPRRQSASAAGAAPGGSHAHHCHCGVDAHHRRPPHRLARRRGRPPPASPPKAGPGSCIVDTESIPPTCVDELEDWVRYPVDLVDVVARTTALRHRAERRLERPLLTARAPGATAAGSHPARSALELLVERPAQVTPTLAARRVRAGGGSGRRALKAAWPASAADRPARPAPPQHPAAGARCSRSST